MSWLDFLRGPSVGGGFSLGPLTVGGPGGAAMGAAPTKPPVPVVPAEYIPGPVSPGEVPPSRLGVLPVIQPNSSGVIDTNQGFNTGPLGQLNPPAPFARGMPRGAIAEPVPAQAQGLKDVTPPSPTQPKFISGAADTAAAAAAAASKVPSAVRSPGPFHGLTPISAGAVAGFMPRQPLPTEVAQGDLLGQFKGKLQADLAAAQGNKALIDKAYSEFGTNAERILSNNFGMLAALQQSQETQ